MAAPPAVKYVSHVVQVASISNSFSAVVLGLVAFIYLSAVALVVSMQVNVVLAKKLYPRALLAPFTDDVDLTEGDQAAYADAAKAEQQKGFETVDVSFENDGKNATTAQRGSRRLRRDSRRDIEMSCVGELPRRMERP